MKSLRFWRQRALKVEVPSMDPIEELRQRLLTIGPLVEEGTAALGRHLVDGNVEQAGEVEAALDSLAVKRREIEGAIADLERDAELERDKKRRRASAAEAETRHRRNLSEAALYYDALGSIFDRRANVRAAELAVEAARRQPVLLNGDELDNLRQSLRQAGVQVAVGFEVALDERGGTPAALAEFATHARTLAEQARAQLNGAVVPERQIEPEPELTVEQAVARHGHNVRAAEARLGAARSHADRCATTAHGSPSAEWDAAKAAVATLEEELAELQRDEPTLALAGAP